MKAKNLLLTIIFVPFVCFSQNNNTNKDNLHLREGYSIGIQSGSTCGIGLSLKIIKTRIQFIVDPFGDFQYFGGRYNQPIVLFKNNKNEKFSNYLFLSFGQYIGKGNDASSGSSGTSGPKWIMYGLGIGAKYYLSKSIDATFDLGYGTTSKGKLSGSGQLTSSLGLIGGLGINIHRK